MKLYYSTDHDGHFPVPVASMVLASDETEARALLNVALQEQGVNPNLGYTLHEVDITKPQAIVLSNGDY